MNENIEELKKEIERLRRENQALKWDVEVLRADLRSRPIPKATPEQEAQWLRDLAEPRLNAEEVFGRIIAELEADEDGGPDAVIDGNNHPN